LNPWLLFLLAAIGAPLRHVVVIPEKPPTVVPPPQPAMPEKVPA
jgi:hypothetical protein